MLHNVVTKQVIFSGVYAVCALGYVFTSDIRETGTFRLNPMFLSGNFYMMIFLQLNTVRYLRYLVRAHLTPSLFLREAKLWKYLKDITDEAVAKRGEGWSEATAAAVIMRSSRILHSTITNHRSARCSDV